MLKGWFTPWILGNFTSLDDQKSAFSMNATKLLQHPVELDFSVVVRRVVPTKKNHENVSNLPSKLSHPHEKRKKQKPPQVCFKFSWYLTWFLTPPVDLGCLASQHPSWPSGRSEPVPSWHFGCFASACFLNDYEGEGQWYCWLLMEEILHHLGCSKPRK